MRQFFRNNKKAPEPETDTFWNYRASTVCMHKNCTRIETWHCAYVDKQKRQCGRILCRLHLHDVNGLPYCTRHANTIRAIQTDGKQSLPELDNRTPSLVAWIGNVLDTQVQDIFKQLKLEFPDAVLSSNRVTSKYIEKENNKIWYKNWKILHKAGCLNLRLEVNEKESILASIFLNEQNIWQGIPPWIKNNHNGDTLAKNKIREVFYYNMIKAVVSAIDKNKNILR